mmetsp:Transcript_40755/g.102596  ORF Transcript_40755/g.102596 Transcript_40755/m.102596 type:complete len:121 (+) Transcript_40755:260-622(+)
MQCQRGDRPDLIGANFFWPAIQSSLLPGPPAWLVAEGLDPKPAEPCSVAEEIDPSIQSEAVAQLSSAQRCERCTCTPVVIHIRVHLSGVCSSATSVVTSQPCRMSSFTPPSALTSRTSGQ